MPENKFLDSNGLAHLVTKIKQAVESATGSSDHAKTADKLVGTSGSASRPVWINSGVPQAVTSVEGIPIKATTLNVSGSTILTGSLNVAGSSSLKNLTVTENAVITGDLTVEGTASFRNRHDLVVADTIVLLASGSSTRALANGGGIAIQTASAATVEGAEKAAARFQYDGTNNRFTSSVDLLVPNLVVSGSITASHLQGTASYALEAGNVLDPVWIRGEGSGSAVLSGSNAQATGQFAVAEGYNTIASGIRSHAEGGYTTASGQSSHAEGYGTKASGNYSHAEGRYTTASGVASHAEGGYTTASGWYSHAEGQYTVASGEYSHAEGENTLASGSWSHAEGIYTTASGTGSHAEGYYAIASGSYSHAEGYSTLASGSWSHAEGNLTIASGNLSHAEGEETRASGYGSHAEGQSTVASNPYEHAQGQYNATASGQIFSIGAGHYDEDEDIAVRKNAISVITGSGATPSASVYMYGVGDYDGTNNTSAQSVQEVLKAQNAALIALAAGAKVTLTISPATIYKSTATNVSLVGTLSNVTPSSMRILDGTTVIATTQSSARVAGSSSVNISSNAKTFTCEAVYEGVPIIATANVNARYPIYCGFGTTFSQVTSSAARMSARTSAVGMYSKTSTANGQHFYIMVPSDIADVNTFKMGGAPFVMNYSTGSIGGVSYKIHESGVAYNSGTTLNVEASA